MDKDTISRIIDDSQYSSAIIPALERYVDDQVSTGKYDFEANHHLLKLYQFYPSKVNKKTVSQILIKAMSNLPSTDFTFHLFLISENVQSDELIRNVILVYDLIERAHFKEFWERIKSCPEFEIPGFVNNIRNFIFDLISRTYGCISKAKLFELLNVDVDEFMAQRPELNVEIKDDMVNLPSKSYISASKPMPDSIQYEQFVKLLASMR